MVAVYSISQHSLHSHSRASSYTLTREMQSSTGLGLSALLLLFLLLLSTHTRSAVVSGAAKSQSLESGELGWHDGDPVVAVASVSGSGQSEHHDGLQPAVRKSHRYRDQRNRRGRHRPSDSLGLRLDYSV
ncbi:unnamed protein product [Mesocestoides corti]|uniref:Transmembrane protein n=1 Tax=Mesocestoides corti TaxID=53468 RepID=A0A0R3UIA5_MESCO|nr:unnamed protein product [Mesocestoides corti]